jgi:hypothetical protein
MRFIVRPSNTIKSALFTTDHILMPTLVVHSAALTVVATAAKEAQVMVRS